MLGCRVLTCAGVSSIVLAAAWPSGCVPARLRASDTPTPGLDASVADVSGRDAIMASEAAVPLDAGRRLDAAVSPDARPRPADPPGDDTLELAISWASMPVEAPMGIAPGFDLDGVITGTGDERGCGHPDFVSPAYQDAQPGVDDQLVELYRLVREVSPETDLDADLEASFVAGNAILLRIDHVGSLRDDGEVEVSIMFGHPAPGAAVRMTNQTIEGHVRRVVAPDQSFVIDADSLLDGRARAVFEDAYIVDGRLVTQGTTFSLRVPGTMDRTFVIDLLDARIEGSISSDGIELGVLGGFALSAALARGVASALQPDDMIEPSLIEAVLDSSADIDQDGDGACEAVSAALRIEATRARFVYP